MSLSGNLTLTRGDFTLNTGDFEFPSSGLTAIFGQSGCGKTSFLRSLAGFESSATGEVFFQQQAWLHNKKSVPVHKRQLGYVFQEASLFAHLNVENNLRYGLKRAPKPHKIDFNQVVNWLGLAELLSRDVQTLSGGEKQRVAIGRALLGQPKILMMDEPMAALDMQAKQQILPYLEKLRDSLEIPILYITHSPDEVVRLADTVVFMSKGNLDSIESIEQALNRPDSPLYQNQDPRSVLSATLDSHTLEDSLSLLKVGEEGLSIPYLDKKLGSQIRVVIAANQVSLMQQEPPITSMLNHLPVVVEEIVEFNEYSVLVQLRIKGEVWPLLAQITKRSMKKLKIKPGSEWVAAIKSVSILN